MNNGRSNIKIYKWLKNEINFVVKDLDRKRVPFFDKVPYINLINNLTNEVVLRKEMYVRDPQKSQLYVIFDQTDLMNLDNTFYRYVVTFEDINSVENVLYTDQTFSCHGYMELLDAHVPPPKKPDIILGENFLPYEISLIPPKTVYLSSALKARRLYGYSGNLMTYALYLTNWLGYVTIQTTLESNPPDSYALWSTYETMNFYPTPYTGIYWGNIIGNFSYVRFVYENDTLNTGTFDKLVFKP
ncbi:MAG: hypothetical protein NZZ41_04140 [Candidatus Dojkabacteria bacterium]|nr:hypothetical protein [Candidatus Dojkabacteria bacterium]